MDKVLVTKAIETLQFIADRPLMYIGEYDRYSIYSLLLGIDLGLSITGQKYPEVIQLQKTGESRGWRYNALGPFPDMESKGLSEEEIVKEIIAIHIQTLEELRNSLKD